MKPGWVRSVNPFTVRSRSRAAVNPLADAGYKRKWRYGITPLEYAERLLSQGGVCAICRRPETYRNTAGELASLCVDHNHACCLGKRSCGKCIRGLICRQCNSALGLVRDDIETLRAMIVYLQGDS